MTMVELNEKALEAVNECLPGWCGAMVAAFSTRAHNAGPDHQNEAKDDLKVAIRLADAMPSIRACLSALPAPDDGLALDTWLAECYSGRFTGMVKHPSGQYVLLSDAQSAIQSKAEQIERLTHNEAETFQKYVDANEARLDAEQQVQKLTAENERLREALRPFSRIAAAEDYADTPPGSSVIVNVDLCRAARSALETQEGGE